MKRLLVILCLIPSLALAAFTEFYCDAANGSNVNGGSDAGTVTYTSTNGNWSTVTNIFTPTDGSNPVSAGVAVGQFASIYVDGATLAVYIARVTNVVNASNGAITVSATARAGTAPTTSATGRSIKVGGAWKGPNAGVGFPFNLAGVALSNATDTSGNPVRVNLKNNATYSITSGIVASSAGVANCVYQGYSSSSGDGGKAEISGGATAITIITGNPFYTLADLIISSTATTGSGVGIADGSIPNATYLRVVVHGHRSVGMQIGASSVAYECEAYDNNKGNGSTNGSRSGFASNGAAAARFIRCYSHDNPGSNTFGFESPSGNPVAWINCIADTNGADGFNYLINGNAAAITMQNCDSYNNTGDGFGIDFSTGTASIIIENCNFIKNGGKGINNTTAAGKINAGFVYNCGYGSGTQANSGGDATLGTLIESGKITYASGASPYFAPTTGDFRISLQAAYGTGVGTFTQTDGTNTGTVGYPDLGAAQHNDTCSGLGPCQTSGASAH